MHLKGCTHQYVNKRSVVKRTSSTGEQPQPLDTHRHIINDQSSHTTHVQVHHINRFNLTGTFSALGPFSPGSTGVGLSDQPFYAPTLCQNICFAYTR